MGGLSDGELDVEVLGVISAGWQVERVRGPVAALHAADLPDRRVVRICEVVDAAVVLGSTQSDSLLDRDALDRSGLAAVRRRSGGGAVVLRPGDHLWVDLFVPVGDPLWEDDVELAAWWVGEWWVRVVQGGATVHRDSLSDRRAGSIACFAARGPGEVVDAAGRKLVGVSQRRTSAGARFQTLAYLRWDPGTLPGLLTDRAAAQVVAPILRDRVRAVPEGGGLLDRFLEEAPEFG